MKSFFEFCFRALTPLPAVIGAEYRLAWWLSLYLGATISMLFVAAATELAERRVRNQVSHQIASVMVGLGFRLEQEPQP